MRETMFFKRKYVPIDNGTAPVIDIFTRKPINGTPYKVELEVITAEEFWKKSR